MENILFLTAQLIVAVVAFLIGKYVMPSVPKDTLSTLSQWAYVFVRGARKFLVSKTGAEKMDTVVAQLMDVALDLGIYVTEDQIRAIAQAAYDSMKAGVEDGPCK